jgi:hypothetical protein
MVDVLLWRHVELLLLAESGRLRVRANGFETASAFGEASLRHEGQGGIDAALQAFFDRRNYDCRDPY